MPQIKNNKFSIQKRLQSFKYAINGLKILIKEEHNSRIHLLAVIIVIILGFIFEITLCEWIGITLSAGMVIALELINSAIENLADCVTKEQNELIKKAKDLAAGGVLLSSIAALITGLLIFIPKLAG